MKGELRTRDRIVRAADELFYQRGFESTSFADIAQAVHLSRGNFYHHFKSKDDLLDAVVQARIGCTQQMLDQWESGGVDARERLILFIEILVRNQSLILEYGCPIGTLCSELAKLEHPARPQANRLLTMFRTWLRRQFESLGHAADADRLAMQLLARSQGVATLANALHDPQFLQQEVCEMKDWLNGMLRRPARNTAKITRLRKKSKKR